MRSTPPVSQVLPCSKSDRHQKSSPNKFRHCPLVKESAVICQLPLKMADEIDFENGRISNFQHHVTLTLDRAILVLHTIMHHSSTSTYEPNFIRIGETFFGRADKRTQGRTDNKASLIGSTRSRPNVGATSHNSSKSRCSTSECKTEFYPKVEHQMKTWWGGVASRRTGKSQGVHKLSVNAQWKIQLYIEHNR